MPCAMCAGAAVQFGIPVVVAGEDRTFPSGRPFMESSGLQVIDLDLDECYQMLQDFAQKHPELWNEDIGVS
jgi:cytosine/creatinine deaminase